MSDFPISNEYKTPLSKNYIKRFNKTGFHLELPVVIKREKDQYIYDIDNYKYIDFFLNNGSVILGHNCKTIGQSVKNGISVGTSSSFVNKFDNRLVRIFADITDFNCISFFNGLSDALIALINFYKPGTIGVSSVFLKNLLINLFQGIEIDIAGKNKKYNLLIIEPLDFDGNLEIFPVGEYMADIVCSFESRTAFRLKFGFVKNLNEVDLILSSNNISNGMDSAVILSKDTVPGDNIPSYKSLAIIETIGLCKRRIDYAEFNIKSKSAFFKKINKNIFLINPADVSAFLSYGVLLKSNIGYISYMHTEYDIKRLEKSFSEIFI